MSAAAPLHAATDRLRPLPSRGLAQRCACKRLAWDSHKDGFRGAEMYDPFDPAVPENPYLGLRFEPRTGA